MRKQIAEGIVQRASYVVVDSTVLLHLAESS